jgi:hypothetical protein
MSPIVTRPYKPVTVMPRRILLMVLSEGSLIGLPGIARPHAVCPTRVDHAEAAKLFRSLGSVARADNSGTGAVARDATTGRPFGLQAAQNADALAIGCHLSRRYLGMPNSLAARLAIS